MKSAPPPAPASRALSLGASLAVAAIVALLALVGYAYGVESLRGFSPYVRKRCTPPLPFCCWRPASCSRARSGP